MGAEHQYSQIDQLAVDVSFFHNAVEAWLATNDITIACGQWRDGAISELIPMDNGELLPARYDGCFTGVRELRLHSAPHHLHIDFGRIHCISYCVAPSICLGMKPAFEARLLILGPGNIPTDRWVVSLMLTDPYCGTTLNTHAVEAFFRLALSQAAQRPDLVDIDIEPDSLPADTRAELLSLLQHLIHRPSAHWAEIKSIMKPATGKAALPSQHNPPCLALLKQALALHDASLVIFRDKTLIEFKTDMLDGVHYYEEHGIASWQIGAFDQHHCHLSLGIVEKVLFSAEPVSCQGGGLNYSVWFLVSGSCGNPYRRNGYFSIVLNRPYTGHRPRLEVIEPVLSLYRSFCHEPWVHADDQFLQALKHGAPARHQQSYGEHDAETQQV